MVSREPKKSRREGSLSTSLPLALSLSLSSRILEPRRGVCEDRGKCARVRVCGCVDARAVRPQESAEKRMARSTTAAAAGSGVRMREKEDKERAGRRRE